MEFNLHPIVQNILQKPYKTEDIVRKESSKYYTISICLPLLIHTDKSNISCSYSTVKIIHLALKHTDLRVAGVPCVNALSLIKHFVHCLIGCGEEAEQSSQGILY